MNVVWIPITKSTGMSEINARMSAMRRLQSLLITGNAPPVFCCRPLCMSLSSILQEGTVLACLFICLSIPNSAYSQKILKYDSTYINEKGDTGMARFDYFLRSGERIKHGEFQFNSFESDSIYNGDVHREEWRGAYDHNRKEGSWSYSTRKFRFRIEGFTEKGINYDLVEIRSVMEIGYKEGFPEGAVHYKTELFSNSRKIGKMETLQLNIQSKQVNGEVHYMFSKDSIQRLVNGACKDGLLTGTWTIERSGAEEKEVRIYDQGVLTSLLKLKMQDTVAFIDFPLSESLEEHLKGNRGSFEMAGIPLSLTFSDGYPRSSRFLDVQKEGNRELQHIIDLVFEFDSGIQNENGLIFGANRGIYPLSPDEKKTLESWPDVLSTFKDMIARMEDSLNTYSAYSADTVIEALNDWHLNQTKLLEYIRPWDQIILNNQLRFYYRNGELLDYVVELMSADTLNSEGVHLILHYNDTTYSNFLSYIINNLQLRIRTGDSMMTKMNDRIQELLFSSEVTFINEDIITGIDSLHNLYVELPENSIVSPLLDYFKVHYLDSLKVEHKEFMNLRDPNEQVNIGKGLLSRVNNMISIYHESLKIGKKSKSLDSLYTEKTFDPFTYEEIEIRSKKRLYGIVLEEMVAELLKIELSPRTDLTAVNKNLWLVSKLQEIMIYMHNKDTRRIEKSLKRNPELEERLKILHIK